MVLQSPRKLHHSWSGEREIGLAKELFIRDLEFAFLATMDSWEEQKDKNFHFARLECTTLHMLKCSK
jgi:hypothetical protein